METFKLSKDQTKNLFLVLLAIFTVLITQLLDYAASAEELTVGGLMFAGNIDMAHVNDMLEKQGEAFEKRMKQLDRLDKEVAEMAKKANRKRFSGGGSGYGDDLGESKSDLAAFLRGQETKGMNMGSGPDGGFLRIPYLQDSIGTIARNTSALRQLVTVTEMEYGSEYVEVISTTPTGVKWVGETESRDPLANPQLVQITTLLHEHYAQPVISQQLVDDSSLDLVDFLVRETSLSFSEAEELALFYGTGLKQPWGLDTIGTSTDNDSVRPWGTIQYTPSGADGAFSSTDPFDAIKKLFYSLRANYRNNAKWVCNSEMALELSKIKDGSGAFYLWDDSGVKNGSPATLLGRPVVISETAPDVASGSKSLWFGDWDQALRAVERPGNKLLLDPYSDKPNLRVYVYRRFGLGLRNSNAIKCLKLSAS
jgi:HK97 family phage major capsid protein